MGKDNVPMYTMQLLFSCENRSMGKCGEHYVKCNKPGTEKQIPCDHVYGSLESGML